jgi:citrate lyase subunit beta/citryl-CoA lyase
MLANARELEADEVILDLEDSVAPAEKTDDTRQLVVDALVSGAWRARTRAVRVNGVGTPWCLRDVQYVVERAGAALDCLVLPKVEVVSELHFFSHLLDQLEGSFGLERTIGIEAQIETPRGLIEIDAIAAASRRLEALVFGPGDFGAALGVPQLSVGRIEPEYPGDQWHYVRARIAVAARAFGLQAVDGPYAAVRDLDGFRESARRAALLGFDGKWAVHPDQIRPCNESFSPTQTQFDDATALLEAYGHSLEEHGAGAASHRGEMIDEASRKMAEAVVARGRAAGLGRG